MDSYFKTNKLIKNSPNSSNINYLLKSIKFIEKPEFDYVIDQLQVILKNKNSIINKLGYIDLKFK